MWCVYDGIVFSVCLYFVKDDKIYMFHLTFDI